MFKKEGGNETLTFSKEFMMLSFKNDVITLSYMKEIETLDELEKYGKHRFALGDHIKIKETIILMEGMRFEVNE